MRGLANQGNLDKKFAKNEPFVWGLSPIYQQIGIWQKITSTKSLSDFPDNGEIN